MSDLVFSGERYIPGIDDKELEMEHIQRYTCISKYMRGKTVLDAACGEGYGSAILAKEAAYVLGIDISKDAVEHAREKYSTYPNLSYEVGDVSKLSEVVDRKIDVVVSFETIEHIDEEKQIAFLNEIRKILKPDGFLIMSTPNKAVYSDMFSYHNEFHIHEFSMEEFRDFLGKTFRNIKFYSQSLEINSVISDPERDSTDALYRQQGVTLENSKYYIALAGNRKLPDLDLTSVFFCNQGQYNENRLRIIEVQNEEEKRNAHIKELDARLEEKGSEIFSLQEELVTKDKSWTIRLDEARAAVDSVARSFTNKMEEMANRCCAADEQARNSRREADEKVRDSQKITEEAEKRIQEAQNSQQEAEKRVQEAEVRVQEAEARVQEAEARVQEAEQRAREAQEKFRDVEMSLLEAEKRVQETENIRYVTEKRLNEQMESLRRETEQTIEDLNRQAEERFHKQNDDFRQELEEKDHQAQAKLDEAQRVSSERIDDLVHQTEAYEDKQKELQQIIKNKEGHIEQLLDSEREFNRVQATRSYRFAQKIHNISNALVPGGSTRRFVLGTALKVVRHPVKMFKFFSFHRIKKFFWLLKMGGMDAVKYRFRVLEANELSDGAVVDTKALDIAEVTEEQNEAASYEKIGFTEFAHPLVSIIIPVYNQFSYTYECLKAISRNTEGVSYEVIIADDNSTDITKSITDIVQNIRVVKNQTGQGFLLNCNYAAGYAKGKYLFFLNNDTQVQPEWLSSLTELMDKDESIGLAGSKLIYGNGQLQEAGGILWKDGSAWNYGSKKDPQDPEFNYVKEVDYISGAAIMIRAGLWKELGGFDETFAPAYYEDTDLAFRVRQKGYRVVYQPKSVVVHFEGISNGTDTSTGLKAYQVVNAQKFYEKWKDVLEKDHFPNGENVFLAKDRSRYKTQILVVDHYVPHFDNDAGGRCTFMWLKMFVKLGMKVTFIGDNFYKHEPYTTILNQMGIEVLYGNFYYNNWKEWLKENLHYFDYIYLQRPHISIKYIDIVKEYGRGKIFYFAHDLHFLRLEREYKLSGDKQALRQSEDIKKTEMYLFDKADVVHVVGSYEQQYLQSLLPDKTIRNIPLYIYEEMPENIEKNFLRRQDIIFVGGFGHPPNIDAVLWFSKEVFPKVQEAIAGIRWHIVGGKVPEEIQNLNGDDIIVHGFVSDEELGNLYRACRLAVVPLRVGAGVKGKCVEAAYYQIPLVTTSIGGEGISSEEGAFIMEDDADRMASEIIRLYQDPEALRQMSDNGIKLIQNHYTLDAAYATFKQDM